MREKDVAETKDEGETQAQGEERRAVPVYQKPVLRKYDQIEQVKPYGPSEFEAG